MNDDFTHFYDVKKSDSQKSLSDILFGSVTAISPVTSVKSQSLVTPIPEKVKAPKKKKSRCSMCRKKVGLHKFECKCSKELVFCGKHRYPGAHDCQYDHMTVERAKLAKMNPKIVADKISKI